MTKMTIITECPTCGNKDLDTDANFCTQCATDLRPYQSRLECCGKVGLFDRQTKYCVYCGAKQ